MEITETRSVDVVEIYLSRVNLYDIFHIILNRQWDCEHLLSQVSARFVCRAFNDILKRVRAPPDYSAKLARQGYLSLLQWAYSQGCSLDEKTSKCAARNGSLAVLAWLDEVGCSRSSLAFPASIREGHLCNLGWLLAKNYPWQSFSYTRAAQRGDLTTMKWLYKQGCPHEGWACSVYGFFIDFPTSKRIFSWMKKKGMLWSELIYDGAVQGGCIEHLQWLREQGCPWDEEACSTAALFGHLEVLKWLRKEGCPWDSYVYLAALGQNQMEVLQWAREEGCPWDEELSNEAVHDVKSLKWLIENGCPYNKQRLVFSCWNKARFMRQDCSEALVYIEGLP